MLELVEIKRHGKTVSRSKNLRGLLNYANRHSLPVSVDIVKRPAGEKWDCILRMEFADGATVETGFADYSICHKFISRRLKRWGLAVYPYGTARFRIPPTANK